MSSTPARFFVPGGALAGDAACYVERRADQELLDALRAGEFCYVLTARQMGKSSLMVHTAAQLRQRGATVVGLDFTAIGQNLAPEQWYCGLLDLIGEQLDLEEELADSWKQHEGLGPLQRWRSALLEVVVPHVCRSASAPGAAGELSGRLILLWTRSTPFSRSPSRPTSSLPPSGSSTAIDILKAPAPAPV
jgi:hypothetical protein